MTLPDIPGVLTIEGQAAQSLPLVLDSPHSGTAYPADFGAIAPMHLLRNAEDTHVHRLFGDAVGLGAVLLHALFPRIYVDANRAADDMDPAQIDGTPPWPLNPGPKSLSGIGLCWTRVPPDGGPLYAAPLSAQALRHRVDTYYRPYHQALDALLDGSHARWGQVWHLNCHSMPNLPSAMNRSETDTGPRADFVLGDRDGTTCAPNFTETVREFLAGRGYSVKVNDPYKGVELVRRHGRPAEGRHSLQVEVNRRIYMDDATRNPNAAFDTTRATLRGLAGHLAAFIQDQT